MKLKRITLKVPKPYQLILFITLATSWFSGISFFIMRTFITVEGAFGPQAHPWQHTTLSIHGLAAFLMMIWFGSLISAHVPMGWRTKKLRFWGISLLSVICLQIITAYLLYYMTSEDGRVVIGYIHLIVGACLPAVLYTHIAAGINSRKQISIQLKAVAKRKKEAEKKAA